MLETEEEIPRVDIKKLLKEFSYDDIAAYMPTVFSIHFVDFFKAVTAEIPEENATPPIHYKMLDMLTLDHPYSAAMCFRGLAKSAVFAEISFLYAAAYGELGNFKDLKYMLYCSDSIDNGVKKMRKRIERRYNNSAFLKSILEIKFTDTVWYFKSKEDGREFVVTGHGIMTGVRGTTELNTRPQIAVIDDVISDQNAKSDSLREHIENFVYKAIKGAMHPIHKLVWVGTPFDSGDPLYTAIESGAWNYVLAPICETFPCKEEDFKGGWSDRFTYGFVLNSYRQAKVNKQLGAFYQEFMLDITSEDSRLVTEEDIQWYPLSDVIAYKDQYNFYITTDFATSEKDHADYSVISVWAIDAIGNIFWVDGVIKKQYMDVSIDDLFNFVQIYNPKSVGIEVSGQQGGFVTWIKSEMRSRNIRFTLASSNNGKMPGIRPVGNKFARFNTVKLWFSGGKMHFPVDLKNQPVMVEIMDELLQITARGFKSRYDDFIDSLSMLSEMGLIKPANAEYTKKYEEQLTDVLWDDLPNRNSSGTLDRYTV